MPKLQSELRLIEQSLDYIARRLKGLLEAADMLEEYKTLLDTYDLQTIIEEVREIEESVKHIGEKQ